MITSADDQPHDFRVQNGWVTIRPEYTIVLPDGRKFRFEWHKYLGPVFLGKRGEPLAQQPGGRHPVWVPFSLWCKQGRRVDRDGWAVWEVA